MAEIRSAPPPMIPPRPANAARAAFFQSVAAPVPSNRETAPQPQARAQPAAQPQPQTQAEPARPLRPGSIIDIRV